MSLGFGPAVEQAEEFFDMVFWVGRFGRPLTPYTM